MMPRCHGSWGLLPLAPCPDRHREPPVPARPWWPTDGARAAVSVSSAGDHQGI